MNLELSFRRYYAATVGLAVSRSTPIVIYQMGRVGSSSLRNALLLSDDPRARLVLHCHDLLPVRTRDASAIAASEEERCELAEEIEHARATFAGLPWRQRLEWRVREALLSRRIYRHVVAKDRPAKFITLVREPVAASISMFFQVFSRTAGEPYTPGAFTSAELIELLKDRYRPWRPLTWFDLEIRSMLGIDVYAHSFPTRDGHQVLSRGNFELLILECDTDDAVKEAAITEYLGLAPGFRLLRSNTAAERSYGAQYRELKETIRFDAPFLDRMYGSRYARHFYSPETLARLRERWGGT